MTTIILCLIVIVIFLLGALILMAAEASGGYIGDSSMVPVCLFVMVLLVGAVLFIGFLAGNLGVWFK